MIYKESNEFKGETRHFFVKKGEFNVQTFNAKSGSFVNFVKNAFLPRNYPDSVSSDYFEYQFWDTIQAFASSISGSLATQVSNFL